MGDKRPAPDGRLSELFSRLVDYRTRAPEDPRFANAWAGQAIADMAELRRELLAWVVDRQFLQEGMDPPRHDDPEERRALLASRLEANLPLPSWGAGELSKSLYALNNGQVEDVLKPSPTKRRGRPMDKVAAKLRLLAWIEWRAAHGVLMKVAEGEAADAIGKSVAVFKQWRHVEMRDIQEVVQYTIQNARDNGEAEARGERPDSAWEHDREQRALEALARALRQAETDKVS